MSRLSLSSSATFLRKGLSALLLTTVSLLVISDVTIMVVKAQTTDIETLRNRVIDAVKGLNEGALRGFFADTADNISYQSKAFLHLSEQVGVDGFSDPKLAQYYALYCIYHATNGVANDITDADVRFENIVMPEWLIATNWMDETTVDPCGTTTITPTNGTTVTSVATTLSATISAGWFGVTCDVEGRVVALDLFENFLTGIWPEEILLLASDGAFSSGAGNLERLDLYQNEFLSNGGDSTWMSDLGLNMSEY